MKNIIFKNEEHSRESERKRSERSDIMSKKVGARERNGQREK